MYWGATIKGSVYGMPGEAPSAAAVWERFEHDADKKVSFINTGQNWAQFDTATMNAAIAGGAIPLVTMGLPSGVTLEEVVDGAQDAQIRAWAKKAAEWGYPFMFRPWREMNGSWYSWGRDPNFVAAWRHFHDLVVEEGATNVTWAWIVNTIWSDPGSDPTPYYPGDAYVDWVGMDAYNWGRNPIQPDRWLSPEQAVGPTLEVLEQIAPTKPAVLTEVASTEYGGDKASWIRDFLGSYLPNHPNIKAMLWFNWNVPSGGQNYDWPIESSMTAEQAFRDGIQSDEYLSERPPLTKLTKVPPPAWPGPAEAIGAPGPTALADGVWEPATEVGASGADERGAQAAVGPDGAITTIWSQFDGSNWVVLERRIGEGGSPLGPVHQLSAPGGNAFDAHIVAEPNGAATAVWKRFDGSTYVIQERRVDPQGEPEAEVHNLSAAGQFAGQPQVAAGPDGGAVAVWERYSGYRTRIQSRAILPSGAPASFYELSDNLEHAVEPQVAIGPSGRAIVVWAHHDGTEPNGPNQVVEARGLAPGGVPEPTTYVLTPTGQDAIEPDVAIASGGKAIVSWTLFDGSHYVVQARQLSGTGEPEAAAFDLSEPALPALQPHVVALSGGSASAVWKQRNGSNFEVVERRIDADGNAANAYTLSPSGDSANEAQVAAGADGGETVVWTLDQGAGKVVQARRIDAGGVPGSSTAGLSDAGGIAGAPFVAAGGPSSAAVVWRRFDGVHDRVQLSAFGVPAATVSPASHDFGTVTVGAPPPTPETITIANPGSAPLRISSLELEGADAGQFRIEDSAPCAGAVLDPGTTCRFAAAFDPTAAGSMQAQLRVVSDAYSGPAPTTLTGTAVAAGAAPPATAPAETASGPSGSAPPDNRFRFGHLTLDRRNGSASLAIWLPGPGVLRIQGGGVGAWWAGGRVRSHANLRVAKKGTVTVKIASLGSKRRALLAKGSVKLVPQFSYLPDGGSERTRTHAVELRRLAASSPRSGR